VIIDNLEPGKSYNLNELASSPFKLVNNFEDAVVLNLQVLPPKEEELKPGYKPLEDVSWVDVQKEVKISPQGQEIVPVQLSIPDDAEYLGKKYQLWIWSYTTGKAIGVGLKSRIMISIVGTR